MPLTSQQISQTSETPHLAALCRRVPHHLMMPGPLPSSSLTWVFLLVSCSAGCQLRLASASLGQVYQATLAADGRLVAVKVGTHTGSIQYRHHLVDNWVYMQVCVQLPLTLRHACIQQLFVFVSPAGPAA